MNYGYSALPPILMHGQAYPMIFNTYGYCRSSTFHHWSWYDAKDFSFSVIEAAVHTWQDAIRHLSASTCTAPNVLTFELFLMLSSILKLLCHHLLMILQVQLVPDMSLHEVMPPILHLQTFLVCQSVLYIQHQNHYFWSI